MARVTAGLAHLVEVAHDGQRFLALLAQVHQRLAPSQGGVAELEEVQDQLLRVPSAGTAVLLRLGPAGAGYEEHVGFGPHGGLAGGRRLQALDRGPPVGFGQVQGHGLHLRGAAFNSPGLVAAGLDQEDPGPPGAAQGCLHALPVVPAGDLQGIGDPGDVRVRAPAQSVGHAGHHPVRPAGVGDQDQAGSRLACQGFGGRGVRPVARLRQFRAGNPQDGSGPAPGDLVGGRFHLLATGEEGRRVLKGSVKIGVTGDFHGTSKRLGNVLESLQKEAPDVVVILGDSLGGDDLSELDRMLSRFSKVGTERIYVTGNHDLWVRGRRPRPNLLLRLRGDGLRSS